MTEASEVPFGLEITKGVVGKFLMAALGFVGTIVFARVLGPVTFGGYYLVWSVVQIANLPIDGLSNAGKKRFSESDTDRSAIVGATLLAVVVVVTTILVGTLAFRRYFVSFTGLDNAVLLFAVLFCGVMLFSPFHTLLSGTGRVGLTIWIDLFRSVLTTPLQIALVLLGFGATGMAFGLVTATILTAPITYYYLGVRPSVPRWKTIVNLWDYARYSIPGATLGRIYNRLDVLVLGFLLTPAAAGQYEVALKFTIPAVLIPNTVGNGLMARVSNLDSKDEAVYADISNALSFSSILAIPIFFGALTIAEPLIVTTYGPEYQSAAGLLIGLALFRLFESQSDPLSQALNGLDRPDVNVKLGAVALAVNILLGIPLTLWIGPIGIVIGTVVAEALKYAASTFLVHREAERVSFLTGLLKKQFLAGGIMALVVFGLRQFVAVASWIDLLVLVGVGAAVYGAVLVGISEQLRATARSIVSSSRAA